MMTDNQCVNPYLPSWEYVPDGEPHVFNGRVYVYGSHDQFNGYVFCQNDYVCWSAPVDDLSNWRYEGVIYKKTQDPLNADGHMCLYAPDVTRGPDGRYYLYYVLDKVSVVSVAVCDTPAGKYQFYGYVHYKDGTRLGERAGDEPQFDPGVLTENGKTYLYTGFCSPFDTSRHGPMATVLDSDMLTVIEDPVFILPSKPYNKEGGDYAGHEFFEASSIRKIKGKYYFVYSSIVMHELCYAVSDYPTHGFKYKGVIVSNCDAHIDTYKPADKQMYYPGNNHGGITEANGNWYIFYHRHTNATSYSRQGCIEKINILEDGTIPQVEITSCCGIKPLIGRGEYPTYIACNLVPGLQEGKNGFRLPPWVEGVYPKITQDGKDGDKEIGFIANMNNGAIAGFKYFKFEGVKRVSIYTRGYGKGVYEVRTSWDGDVLGEIAVDFTDVWTKFSADIAIPDGVHALYFTFKGSGSSSFRSFVLE
ncbi:family 43 glycosylhydrolase [Thermocaproicibacter melissae]|jgi:arabinoxylan arabinofuranohydrolase|uniref:family 43 glycosylhydrolase n=1 Tax=Thermocaproicibacter melissae TaxID=2966552 RepID=UPI003D160749